MWQTKVNWQKSFIFIVGTEWSPNLRDSKYEDKKSKVVQFTESEREIRIPCRFTVELKALFTPRRIHPQSDVAVKLDTSLEF